MSYIFLGAANYKGTVNSKAMGIQNVEYTIAPANNTLSIHLTILSNCITLAVALEHPS